MISSTGEKNSYFNNRMIIKIEVVENGHIARDWKILKELSFLGFTIKPRRIESYFRGISYSDFELFHKKEEEFRIDENGEIIVRPSVKIQYLGGWEYKIEKYFDTYEEAKKYSQKMLTKESTTWTNPED